MLRRLVPIALVCTLLGTGVANSTTVIAPTFSELVSKASLIFVGQVANVRAIWENTPQGRAIITIVTFRVEDVWKGSAGTMTQLEFVGGTLDGMTLDVVGMPNFTVGQRDVLFVGDTVKTMSPLVGFMHGRFRVERDLASGVDRVRTHDGRSLPDVGEIGANRPPAFLSMTPMRLGAFEAAVAGQISAGEGTMKSRTRFVVMLAAVTAMLLGQTATPDAYNLHQAKWPNGNVVFHLQLGSGSGTLLDGKTSWGAAAEEAISIWNSVLNNVRITVVRDSTTPKGDGDRLNHVFFDSTQFGRSFGSSTLAVCYYWFAGTLRVEADTTFNTAFTWNSYRGNLRSGVQDFRRVAIHEFGHSFGLLHPDDAGQNVSSIMNSIVSNIDTITADDIAGAQTMYGAGVSANISFPPRNEPNDFFNQLIALYRDFLGAALSGTYVDPEGAVIWLTEYARQIVGQCDHAAAVARTLAQITGTGGTLVCALTPLGPIPFPARNVALDFMNQLNSTYQTVLGRSLGSSYVNNEGAVVWVLEYLRYRLNGCGHGDAVTKVFQQIRGQGIQPVCR